mmetsp:Transcript_6410/g.20458  ORF Transcript_6410/g.20458 Transcript_6410/m.20458 type:complete len:201 (+) Transcript_6410:547-1149(+)
MPGRHAHGEARRRLQPRLVRGGDARGGRRGASQDGAAPALRRALRRRARFGAAARSRELRRRRTAPLREREPGCCAAHRAVRVARPVVARPVRGRRAPLRARPVPLARPDEVRDGANLCQAAAGPRGGGTHRGGSQARRLLPHARAGARRQPDSAGGGGAVQRRVAARARVSRVGHHGPRAAGRQGRDHRDAAPALPAAA